MEDQNVQAWKKIFMAQKLNFLPFFASRTLILTSTISLPIIAKLNYLGYNLLSLWRAKELDICLDAMFLHLEAILMI